MEIFKSFPEVFLKICRHFKIVYTLNIHFENLLPLKNQNDSEVDDIQVGTFIVCESSTHVIYFYFGTGNVVL